MLASLKLESLEVLSKTKNYLTIKGQHSKNDDKTLRVVA